MKFALVSGSHRKQSQSGKVARFAEQLIRQHIAGSETYRLDLGTTPLPLWDEEVGQQTERWRKAWARPSAELTSADAVVIVSPEWSGMVPAGLKNFFLLCNNGELAHKPGLIVTVSAGTGGAYPVAELRMSSYKNAFFCYIPDHVIIRKAESVFNDGAPTADADTYLRNRLTYALTVLHEYGKALKLVRESGVIDLRTYSYGM